MNDAAFFVSHRLVLAQAARAAGYRVVVATGPGQASQTIIDSGLEHRELPMTRSGTSPIAEVRLLFAIARLFRTVRPDLVHLVTIKPVLYGGILARVLRVPARVAAVTGMGYLFTESRKSLTRKIAEILYRLALNHPNGCVIFQNNEDWQYLVDIRALEKDQGTLIPGSGVDLATFQPTDLPEGPPIVLFPARMLWDKGAGEFVEAARALRGNGSTARFVMVGPCDPENPAAVSREQIESWQNEGIVEWWGARNDMPQVLASANLVVLPSYREGMPKVLLESAAAGRAVLTTDVPGCRDAIDPGRSGMLVPPQNAQALASAIEQLLADRTRLGEMGHAGRDLAKRIFGIDRVIDAHLTIYHDLLAGTICRPARYQMTDNCK